MRFGSYMVPEVHQKFWEAMARGEFITEAAQGAGSYRKQGARWLVACGGVRPWRGRNLKGRCLTFAEREEIALLRTQRQGVRQVTAAVGRPPSTISRELRRNADRRGGYRASTAHAAAYERASRPKEAKLVTHRRLRERVESNLEEKYSPEQIAGQLRREFPDDPADAGAPRDDLPSALPPVPWCTAAGAHPKAAHRAQRAQTWPQGRPAQEPHPKTRSASQSVRRRPMTVQCPDTGRGI